MNHVPIFRISVALILMLTASSAIHAEDESLHRLAFPDLAARWDEALPLGNGMLGALVWREGDVLRFSLDRADLWDNRPVPEFERPEFTFDWMAERIAKGDLASVQKLCDLPYERDPAPTKIPAGRLEFDASGLDRVTSAELNLDDAVCRVSWKNGTRLETFVHAELPVGWFRLTGVPAETSVKIVPPPFGGESDETTANSVSGHDLRLLGYPAPDVTRDGDSIQYVQQGWGGFRFAIVTQWRRLDDGSLEGVWSIASTEEGGDPAAEAARSVREASRRGFDEDLKTHLAWWSRFWKQSDIHLPDRVLEKQWRLEQYKFGAAARRGAPPISLQAVWTADERRIPPWRGDFHHDLNTQLSYWPCYSANHLEEGLGFLDWLWSIKPVLEDWTHRFYGAGGLNAPGVTTIHGDPMGGWSQYSLSSTTGAWLAQHFYLHWRYSMDRDYLKTRAYPWLSECAAFLESHSVMENGQRKLRLSSSPEINDNRIDAWFTQTTNYDLALIRWLFGAAAELADELGRADDAARWRGVLAQWPELATSADDGRLLVAPGYPLKASHRHFSHLMGIYPLGLVDPDRNEADERIVDASLRDLERLGTDWWTGYSFAWQGCLYARNHEGDNATHSLKIFAEAFCLPNSFHVNGDQSGKGYSKFTYRPFTLEGNFAFAMGVQEMLLQSHAGFVEMFPAIPAAWRDASFSGLRAEGAFVVSAERKDGATVKVTVRSEKGGELRLADPFADDNGGERNILTIPMQPGEVVTLTR